eukprot:c2991_g1_i2.p1 GENE.c2991_g1_i2~~c2991_g1_i2.p1  ORF type:complete len:217 (-),score=52.05 c2991_g1_i2:457-1107(-)
MLLGNFLGFVFSTSDGWRYILGVGGVLGLVFEIGMFFLPSSPRWLVSRDLKLTGRVSESTCACLRRLREGHSETEIQEELQDMVAVFLAFQGGSLSKLLLESRNQLIVAVGLVILQQITGQTTILYYSADLLRHVFGSSNNKIALASCCVTGVKLAATSLSVVLVDRLGRRALLLIGISGMLVATFFLAFVFQTEIQSNFLTMLLLMLYVAAYQVQ